MEKTASSAQKDTKGMKTIEILDSIEQNFPQRLLSSTEIELKSNEKENFETAPNPSRIYRKESAVNLKNIYDHMFNLKKYQKNLLEIY